MAYEYKIRRRVEFSETDMAGIVHYSNFFRYMEAAEHAFFRSIGYSVVTRNVDPPVGWPRVHADCDYRRPIRFEDEIEIRMYVIKKKSKSLTYGFWFRKIDGEELVDIASGSLTVVCVTHKNGRMKAAIIPKEISKQIEVTPPKVLREITRKSKDSPRK
jgi:YbgC/YbaW family acyl-CoA thioester hydrolase